MIVEDTAHVDDAPAAAPEPPSATATPLDAGLRAHAIHEARLEFTGSGGDYFRLWIANTLLTLLTLGIYSAWAKVRKMRWFAQHTRLLGDGFDFHAEPRRILAGRVLALALLLAYSHAFDWSRYAGLAIVALLCAVGPLLFASAQRFRLANTSWRGLRFGFDASVAQVYAVCLPAIVLWTWGSVWLAFVDHKGPLAAVAAAVPGVLLVLGFPFIHARLKQLQHRRAFFGGLRFDFEPAGWAFFRVYLAALGFLALGGFVGGAIGGIAAAIDLLPLSKAASAFLVGGIVMLVAYTVAWPYFAARLQRIVWERTRCGPLRFRGEMRAWPLMRLVFGRTLLTVLSLGLYWPFAAVAIARYRVQSLVVESDEPLADVTRQIAAPVAGSRAAGDAAADFFGLDLGW